MIRRELSADDFTGNGAATVYNKPPFLLGASTEHAIRPHPGYVWARALLRVSVSPPTGLSVPVNPVQYGDAPKGVEAATKPVVDSPASGLGSRSNALRTLRASECPRPPFCPHGLVP